MKLISRRTALAGGAGLIGLGAFGYAGSVTFCNVEAGREVFVRPLYVVLQDLIAPEEIGRAYLSGKANASIHDAILMRPDLIGAALTPDDNDRRAAIAGIIRQEFKTGGTVHADRWIVSRTEAMLAAAAVSTGEFGDQRV